MPSSGGQTLKGDQNVQADRGSTVNYTVFQAAPPAPIPEDTLAEALALLDGLPLDGVPEPTGLPLKSRMPLRRNSLFVGREADLRALAATLKAGGTAAVGQVPAVTGLGGLGKSQLASEFVYRYGRFFAGGVFWLSFADPETIATEIAACGGPRHLNLQQGYEGLPLGDQLGLVASAWHSEMPRLLVFDNCEEEDLLEAWLPRGGSCRVIATSRRSAWSPALGVQDIALGLLDRPESIALLREHRPDLAEDDADLAAIAEELGDLPLALHLAGSFLREYRHAEFGKPARYLEALRSPDMLAHASLKIGGDNPTGHEQHVANTFALSYDRLDSTDETDRLAQAALARAGCFAPGEPIPRQLLIASLQLSEDDSGAAMRAEDALGRLGELGLLEAEEEGALLLHRLLAAFVKGRAEDFVAAHEAVEQAVKTEADRLIDEGYPAPLQAWQPHLRAVADVAVQEESELASGLLLTLGKHLRMVADFPGAKAAYERALEISEASYGPNHPSVARDVNNLGGVLKDLGDLPGAKAAFERALAIDEASYGPDHPNVARDVNNLGLVLQALGDLEGARASYERALPILETSYGPDHPDVATAVNNLGLVLRALGDLPGAKAAFERALAIDEASYGPDHPNVARDVNNLGLVLQDLGDLPGAKAALERALKIGEASYGPDHPTVAIRVNNLGLVLQDLGDLPGAKAALERALVIGEASYGPDHPHVATRLNNLGMVLRDLGDFPGARAAVERALKIDEVSYGPDHPHVATRLNNLGLVLRDLGDLPGARAAVERALKIDEVSYGPDHPEVAIRVNNLGLVLQDLGDLPGAKAAFERALKIDEASYGPDHPEVATGVNNLGGVLQDLGDLPGAKAALERALEIIEKVYGSDHPNVATVRNNLRSLKPGPH